MNPFHESNRRGWDARAADWQDRPEVAEAWRRCPSDPSVALDAMELHYLKDVRGRDVAVLGSGDNLVVFALAGMGARVTSVDISAGQLAVAGGRARELGLDVRFVRADVTDLSSLEDPRAGDAIRGLRSAIGSG